MPGGESASVSGAFWLDRQQTNRNGHRSQGGRIGTRLSSQRLILALFCTVAVLVLTHIPPRAMPDVWSIRGFDKVVHATAYAIITLSFLFAVPWKPGRRWPVIVVLGIVVLAALDELTQPFVGRTCCIWDFVADLVGIAIACGVVFGKRVIASRADNTTKSPVGEP